MRTCIILAMAASTAISQVTQVQDFAAPPILLLTTKSGVLPVLPTPFSGVLTEEGAIIDQGPINSTFVGLAGPAIAQMNQPPTTYMATFPTTMFNPYAGGNITGTVIGVGTANGVQFTINIQGLPPSSYGPFLYHIHGVAVPSDGNCTATLGHLDPTNRGEYYKCDLNQPQTCQAGDLAGKHGMILQPGNASMSFTESYLSTNESSPYFFGSGSIVIHTSNTTRLTCANFQLMNSNSSASTSTTTSMPSSTTGSNPSSTTSGSLTTTTGGSSTTPGGSSSSMPASGGATYKSYVGNIGLISLACLALFLF